MSENNALPAPHVDEEVFRNVVGHFASGVTVITTIADGELFGTTASAVSSLSMQPPMMLVCLNRSSVTHDAVRSSGVYGINILSEEQGELASHFGRKGADKFAGVDHTISEFGVPLLTGALATVTCVVDETASGGTHTVFLGRVVEATSRSGDPLAYYRGAFGRFQRSQEIMAYESTRDWVLRRRTPVDAPLDPVVIAEAVHSDSRLVYEALVKLSTESLVKVDQEGNYLQIPITTRFTDGLYEARLAIQCGVIEAGIDSITEQDLADLREIGADLTHAQDEGVMDTYLRLNLAFHSRIVQLADSKELTASFRRLNVGTVWRDTLDPGEWRVQLDANYPGSVIDALERKDAAGTKAALREYTDHVKELARSAIARNGGSV